VALARGSRAAGDEPRKGEHDRGVRTVLIRERKAPVDTASSDSPQSVELAARSVASALEAKPTDALSAALANCQEDAPACDNCGAITVRNGACYRCMNCGHSMGCS
jgi:hypothetical protein